MKVGGAAVARAPWHMYIGLSLLFFFHVLWQVKDLIVSAIDLYTNNY